MLKTETLAASAAITAAGTFTVCAALVALAPELVAGVLKSAWHLGAGGPPAGLSWTSYVLGLCFWAITAFVIFAIGGWLYNRLSGEGGAARSRARVPGL